MKTKLLQGLGFVALGYLLLVALHFIYLELGGTSGGGFSEARMRVQQEYMLSMPSAERKSVSNYATMQFQVAQGQAAVEQKYEKIGSLDSTTDKFEEDEKRTRAVIQQHEALIQEGCQRRRQVLTPDKCGTVSRTSLARPRWIRFTAADENKTPPRTWLCRTRVADGA